ncbi:MAG TPA: SAM-dependent methyltransferase [Ignavibacteriales bacterium]|nr:SAM-dependent methyltransferase [Ignavibacteriales bacterium]
MDIKTAYNIWSAQYDTNENKTRDLEARAIRKTLSKIKFDSCLEIGCGTGKNTEWLKNKSKQLTAVDFSEEMIIKAKQKIKSDNVRFVQADIKKKWNFINEKYDLVTFSLILEHIEELDKIFYQVSEALVSGGYVYIGELHPFKQYSGSKAKFETDDGEQVLKCFNHNISDFIVSGKNNGITLVDLDEYFDDDDRTNIPRILTLLFKKF